MSEKPSTPPEEPLDKIVKVYLNPPKDGGAEKPKLPPHPHEKEGDGPDFEITVGPPEEQSAESTVEDDDILELTEVVEGDSPKLPPHPKKEERILEKVAGKEDMSKKPPKTAIEGVDDTGDPDLIDEFERITAKITIPDQLDSKTEEKSEETAEDDGIDIDITVGPLEKRFQSSFKGSLEDQLEKLNEEAIAKLGEEIDNARMLEGDILAITKGFLVLKQRKEYFLVFGGEYADTVNEETRKTLFKSIESVEQFLEKSAEIPEGIKMAQKDKLEKSEKELSIIGGKIKKHRFLKNDLLLLVIVDKAKHGLADKKTNPELLLKKMLEKGAKIDVIPDMEDGIYVVLAMGDAPLKVFGGDHAHKIQNHAEEIFDKRIKNVAEFFEYDQKIKEKFTAPA